MRIAYFDAGAGVSGDMILGALVDAGLGLDGLRHELAGLGLKGYALAAENTRRAGFRATRVLVSIDEEYGHVHARKVTDILALIEQSGLRPAVKERASAVFRRLGEAEARAHGETVERIHLHEAGAVDALVDVVGSVAGLDALGVGRVLFSPLRLGSGTVQSAHGLLPIPAPAVTEMVKGVPVYAGEIEGEMVTPTGAALATTLAESFGPMPLMTPCAIGLGAGAADRILPNVLRLFLGDEPQSGQDSLAELAILEANLDDMNPEFYDFLGQRLRAAGALDVWVVPVQMKKNRPGAVLSVLAEPSCAAALREVIFTESTTLGLREHRVMRYALGRETASVTVAGQAIRIKVGRRQGRVIQMAPEYEDCRRAASRTGLPLKHLYQLALAKAWEHLGKTAIGGDTDGKHG